MAEDRQELYETRDVSVRFAALLAGGFLAAVLGPLLAISILYGFFWKEEGKTTGLPSAALQPGITRAPALQVSPARDYARFHEEMTQRLESTGWIDREKGIAHIPIGEAMRLYLTRHGAEEDQ